MGHGDLMALRYGDWKFHFMQQRGHGFSVWEEPLVTTRVPQFFNLRSNPFELDAEGMLAVCIQHEMDHLEGKLFVDYLSELKRERLKKKAAKKAKRSATDTADATRKSVPVI